MLNVQFIKDSFHGKHRRELLTNYYAKRVLDLVIASLALFCLIPLMLIVAAIIKITSPGPILYFQKRVGWDLVEFDFPKFRSMYIDADERKRQLHAASNDQLRFKMKNDPRVTPIGRFIRKYSIDELPQLWCVLKGQMSLVGPRPPIPQEVIQYSDSDKMRLMIIPGITGIWQVSGRSDVGFDEQVQMDLMYMANWSIWLDISILLKTVSVVILGKGAY